MLSVDLAFFKSPPAKSSPPAPTVFHLEDGRLGIGQSEASIAIQKVGAKYSVEKIGDFRGKCGVRAASEKSARLLRKAESQMKRKAFVTLSPFDRGLLLGRRAFLF